MVVGSHRFQVPSSNFPVLFRVRTWNPELGTRNGGTRLFVVLHILWKTFELLEEYQRTV